MARSRNAGLSFGREKSFLCQTSDHVALWRSPAAIPSDCQAQTWGRASHLLRWSRGPVYLPLSASQPVYAFLSLAQSYTRHISFLGPPTTKIQKPELLFSHSSRRRKSKIKVSAAVLSPEISPWLAESCPLPLSSRGLSSVRLHPSVSMSLAPFLKETPVRLHQAHLLHVPSPNKVTF